MMSGSSSLVTFVTSTFHVADYVVFAAFLAISSAVGIFFSVRGQKSTQDYFFGGRRMGPVPVGISTGVSFMSASVLVGFPAETFVNGYTIILAAGSSCAGFFLGCVIIASVLQPLSMTSLSEYFWHKYRSRALIYSTNIIVLVCILQYMGVCMLGSVIAFSSVTGGQVSVILALAIGCVVGIFYTTIGGIKAVVWTDVIQFGFMLLGIVVVIVSSIANTPGGMGEIFRLAVKYQRIHVPEWHFDLTVRHTVWGLTIGIMVYWLIWCVQPACVQRLCSTPSKTDAYIVAGIASSIFFFMALLPSWAGINIFGYYTSRGCDVYAAGWIKNNEIILYYVRERLNYPGFQGLFIAALYAGSLSSLSSGLNAASSLLWNDTIKPLLKVEVSDMKATLISKLFVVVIGVVSMAWCYVLYSIGGLIIQMASTIDASMYGAYFGVFVLATTCFYATWKGALVGMICSFAFTLWLGMGSLLSGKAAGTKLATTTINCALNETEMVANTTLPTPSSTCPASGIAVLYSISYEWFSLLCVIVSLGSALIIVGLTGPADKASINPKLVIKWFRPGGCKCTGCEECDNTDGISGSHSGDQADERIALRESESCSSSIKDKLKVHDCSSELC